MGLPDIFKSRGGVELPRVSGDQGLLFFVTVQGYEIRWEPSARANRIWCMGELRDYPDPVREAIAYGESAPADFASWPPHECLRRLRIRFGLNRKQLAAKASVSASLVGRAEKGADIRLSTLRKLYAALGCRLLMLPAGALGQLDRRQAHLDNQWLEWKRKNARWLKEG